MRRLVSLLCIAVLVGCGGSAQKAPLPTPSCLSLGAEPNAVSTSAPARISVLFSVETCSGAPVPGLTAQSFKIREDGALVSAYESQQRISPRSEKLKMFTVLLLDLSGSILRSGGFPTLHKSADAFVDQVLQSSSGQLLSILTFDGRAEPTTMVPFTNDAATLHAGLSSLETRECETSSDCATFTDRRTCAGWRCVDDSTNLNGALVEGLGTLDAAISSATDVVHKEASLVVFTDGTDQAARVSQSDAQSAVDQSTSHVFTVGLGGEIDRAALTSFGKDGFFPADDTSALDQAFGQVAGRLLALSQRYYLVEYCSPKRSGTHTLEIEAELAAPGQPTAHGSFSTSFDASGFTSGCDLGDTAAP